MQTDLEADRLAGKIRTAGLKVTAQRLAVLRALENTPHSSADRVLGVVREELPAISAQAVYGILSAFTDAGVARRIEPAGSPALYESRVGDNHHHLVCISCGTIRDVDCVIGQAPCLAPSDDSGFTVIAAEVTFSGVCSSCRQQAEYSAR
ncbi:transcriptional repressor [Arthrobacter sp. zg-Y40]|uniref:Fur family transcriptional regulator n=1 Tax=unclassified Arthrobacter TaxID=235627 RepID=UPI001D138121|nr:MULTISPECIES: Fur family transcriptional regulator [unclassified Arthrobacter]MCC3279425.1 transcriptional repressor [Arthrobacter sp. zg-Y40]MDK1327623.1 Fur family transcriptional regulator [Arthrobacter sp. zg-Y1143]